MAVCYFDKCSEQSNVGVDVICHICYHAFHRTCAQLSRTAITVLEDGNTEAICRICIGNMIHFRTTLAKSTALDQTIKHIDNINSRSPSNMDTSVYNNQTATKEEMDDHFSKLNQRLDNIFEDLEIKYSDVRKRLTELEKPSVVTNALLSDTLSLNTFVYTVLSESNNINYRANNIILRGLKEQATPNNDSQLVGSILGKIHELPLKNISCSRIGKLTTGKDRPLRVRLASIADVQTVFKFSKSLRQGVTVRGDLTRSQMDQKILLSNMVQTHNAQHPDNVYRVRMRKFSPVVVDSKNNIVFPSQYTVIKPTMLPPTASNGGPTTSKPAHTSQINTAKVLKSLFQ